MRLTGPRTTWGVIKNFDLSDKSLKSLRRFSDSRKVSLIKACRLWKKGEETLKMLAEHEEVWSDDERGAWVDSMNMKKDARKMWKSTLSQMTRPDGEGAGNHIQML